MKYKITQLQEEFTINRIISIHYFEYMNDFTFSGESHNFWEFLYVDKGEVTVTADQEKLTLTRGEIIFHKPNEFHNVSANGVVAPNLVVISFDCVAPLMYFFENRQLTINEGERRLLAQIITEANNAFEGPLDNPYLEQLTRKEPPVFGAEQLIKIYLEQFLIQLYRNFSFIQELKNPPGSHSEKNQTLYAGLVDYLEHHIRSQLTVEQICRDNLISDSQLKKLFREQEHCGVIQFFNQLKIRRAKELIRGQQMNFTQIADYLGYTSVHYFCRQFKQITGMTPTEYTDSVKQLAEPPYVSRL